MQIPIRDLEVFTMPYVAPSEALNLPHFDLEELRARYGPPPWRVPVIATSALRVVLLAWEPGHVTVPHFHTRAEEVFQVLAGRAAFQIGDGPEIDAGPGTVLLGPRGDTHAIRVVGSSPLYMLAVLAPNENAPDETITVRVTNAIP
jgi:mannose-6-phosphate isomerase-like protein (cupin superfamily)